MQQEYGRKRGVSSDFFSQKNTTDSAQRFMQSPWRGGDPFLEVGLLVI